VVGVPVRVDVVVVVEVVEHGVDQALVCDGEQVWVEVNPIGMVWGVPSLAT
jgi:hypothetical protein